MALALTLPQAAGQAFDNLSAWFISNQLAEKIVAFCEQTIVLYPQSNTNLNPVSNWITVLWALGDQTPDTNVPLTTLTDAAEILYRLCWMAYTLRTTQGSADGQLLIIYNGTIGFL